MSLYVTLYVTFYACTFYILKIFKYDFRRYRNDDVTVEVLPSVTGYKIEKKEMEKNGKENCPYQFARAAPQTEGLKQ